ncbi:hypothetical protein [Frondihabitans australicus]|uniref:HEPN domain-containing protein n=1 Tax=Frondihabitans australicus TaxID=386892 RepID=A0A495IIX0_9MICO|nr:hypothetical protein [Frondihabitans australicus]RKR75075.1 hypothetical protein C8E83_2212 [Frondihabitans australicus]
MKRVRTSALPTAGVEVRSEHARAFLAVAQLVVEFGDDADIGPIGNVVGSLSVLSGIAACDAICGAVLGERASGDSHGEAVDLLSRACPGRPDLASRLRQLIEAKTNTQYSPFNVTEAKAAVLLRAADRLVAGMEEELGARRRHGAAT